MTWFALATWSAKEFRALGPLWAACAIAIALHDRLTDYSLAMLAVLAYLFGSVALGALSIGHEFGHRTLGVLLAQPIDRRRLFLVKLSVLAVLLTGLALIASQTLFDARPLRGGGSLTVALLVALCGAFLAQALTMLTRSTLAGSVFTIAVAGIVATGALLVGTMRFGVQNARAIDRFVETVFWPGMFGICAVAAVASWRLFVRLEAIEGGGRQIELGRWLSLGSRSAEAARRGGSPYAALVRKELHLYQMPVVLAAVYAAVASLINIYADRDLDILAPLTVLYAFGIAALVGSLASAEERALGTLEWHMLLPVAMWQQWTIKVAIAFLTLGVLASGVPAALSLVAPIIARLTRDLHTLVPVVILLFAVSLYVSSLCAGGVRALFVSLPVFLGVAWLARWILDLTHYLVYQAGYMAYLRPYRVNPHDRLTQWLFVTVGVLLIGGALTFFGYRNHRWTDWPWQRVLGHAVVMAVILAIVVTAGFVLGV